jgi:dUTPase
MNVTKAAFDLEKGDRITFFVLVDPQRQTVVHKSRERAFEHDT